MGPGFKYHVATIAAIFFALTVGLVVGSLYVSPRVVNQQKRAIDGLRVSLDKKLKEKESETDQQRRFIAAVTPLALEGKLAGATVAIVQTGEYGDVIPTLKETLLLAGARVLSITTLERAFAYPDNLLNGTLAPLHQNTPQIPTDRAGLMNALAQALAHGEPAPQTASADGSLPPAPLLPLLERANLLRLEAEGDYATPARYVVIVAGSRTDSAVRITNTDLPLIGALRKQDVILVTCEPENALFSDIAGYQQARRVLQLDFATVDNVDSTIGRFALIYALRGERDDYGVKPTAKNLLPPALARQE